MSIKLLGEGNKDLPLKGLLTKTEMRTLKVVYVGLLLADCLSTFLSFQKWELEWSIS
jgi:hypothetical protein